MLHARDKATCVLGISYLSLVARLTKDFPISTINGIEIQLPGKECVHLRGRFPNHISVCYWTLTKDFPISQEMSIACRCYNTCQYNYCYRKQL